MKNPNFFIVGAPKCGTSALAAYLANHPNVFFCEPKEPNFFADDFDGHRRIRDMTTYLKLFNNAQSSHLAVGEGSVLYLYSRNAISNIYRFDPHARIIVMLRNPVDLVISLHQQFLHALYEDEPNFEKAWELQSVREKGLSIPRLCRQPELLMYAEISKVGVQLERLLSIFPKEQIKIILFDEFSADVSAVYQAVLKFLQLPDDGQNDFPRVNEAQQIRPGMADFLARNSPVFLRNMITEMRFNRYLKSVAKFADTMFKAPYKRQPLSPDLRSKLQLYFQEDQNLLQSLLSKNFNINTLVKSSDD